MPGSTSRARKTPARKTPAPERSARKLPAWEAPPPRRVRAIRDRLRTVYGIPLMAPHDRPLDELVLTVLSQSTNDRNRDVAFLRLRERFDAGPGASGTDWAAVLEAPVSEVEEAIRPGGISKVKSARIQAILAAIAANPRGGQGLAEEPGVGHGDGEGRGRGHGSGPKHDPLSLKWMRTAPVAESRDYLTALPGVGRKTAACVLLFAYGLRDVPVDTHVSRVGTRLGLLEPGAPFDRLHDQMLALTPPGEELELHVNLLRHGRRTCHARSPACAECDLARMCPSRAEFTAPDVSSPARTPAPRTGPRSRRPDSSVSGE
jgi:endonuclease III